jgi:hypothetical protein
VLGRVVSAGKGGAPEERLHFPLRNIKRVLSIALHCGEKAVYTPEEECRFSPAVTQESVEAG